MPQLHSAQKQKYRKQALRATRQVCRTSVLREIFLRKARAKSPSVSFEIPSLHAFPKRALRARLPPKLQKQAFRTRLRKVRPPSKVKQEVSSVQTHSGALPSSSPIPMSQQHSPPPNMATSRPLAPATTIQFRHLQHVQSTAPATESDDTPCSIMFMSSVKKIPTRSQHTPIHQNGHFS